MTQFELALIVLKQCSIGPKSNSVLPAPVLVWAAK